MLPELFNRLTLNLKINSVLIGSLGVLMLSLVIVTQTAFANLLRQVSQEEVAQGINLLQVHFSELEAETLSAARLLSAAPGLTDALATGSVTQIRTAILLQGASLQMDYIDVINEDEVHVLTLSDENYQLDEASSTPLFRLGLIGADVTGLVAEANDTGGVMLVGIAPVKNALGEIVGATLTGRRVNAALLERLNFGNTNPQIAFIYQDTIISQPLLQAEGLNDAAGQALIDGAFAGRIGIPEQLDTNASNTPTITAYAPLRVGGEVQAVLAIQNRFDALFAFQNRLTTNTIMIVVGLSVGVFLITASFMRRSVTLPLTQLQRASEEIAKGNLTQKVSVRSEDEIGQLSRAFNLMGDKLDDSMNSLRQRMDEAQTARERAEESDQVKSAFLASMSHELRTPLNAVINFSQFVADGDVGEVNEQQAELLSEVIRNSQHLLKLINDVLDMSKIESGSLNLFIADDVSLADILTGAAATGKALLENKPVQIQLEIDDRLPLVRADQQRLTQIFLNIISNACKFTDEGTITVRAYQQEQEVIVAIADTGHGIQSADVAAVFEPFKQTESGLRKGGGTGLGMPISRNLVEAHHGRLWLESEYQRGSTFYVALPVKSASLVPFLKS